MKKALNFNNVLDNRTLTEKLKEDLPHRVIRKQGEKILISRKALSYQRAFLKLIIKEIQLK